MGIQDKRTGEKIIANKAIRTRKSDEHLGGMGVGMRNTVDICRAYPGIHTYLKNRKSRCDDETPGGAAFYLEFRLNDLVQEAERVERKNTRKKKHNPS